MKKRVVLTGLICLSFTLFSFRSVNAAENQITSANVEFSNQSQLDASVNGKTLKLAVKVWEKTCALIVSEVLDWALGDKRVEETNSAKQIDVRLNNL